MLTRKELDEIALEVWNDIKLEDKFQLPTYSKIFAHALLCEVQKRLEVVGSVDTKTGIMKKSFPTASRYKQLTTLPLIEE